jgi:hypothetical protein
MRRGFAARFKKLFAQPTPPFTIPYKLDTHKPGPLEVINLPWETGFHARGMYLVRRCLVRELPVCVSAPRGVRCPSQLHYLLPVKGAKPCLGRIGFFCA